MRKCILFFGLAFLGPALAASGQDEPIDATDASNFFANCAGVWDFHSEIMTIDGKPAVAERLRNMGNGAQTAALWLLASQHAINNGKATRYGSWLDLVTPKREDAKLRMQGLVEMGDLKQIELERDACLSAAEDQEGILNNMRQDRVKDAQEFPPEE